MKDSLVSQLSAFFLKKSAQYNVEMAFLYGSYAAVILKRNRILT